MEPVGSWMRHRVGRHRCLAGLLVFAFLIGVPHVRSAGATTQVDCITPDEFCTGNPCTTTDRLEITVSSCVLDFGSRALVLATGVTVPSGGTLSLTAGSIEVKKKINGQHTGASDGDGADISLSATGSIVVGGRIVASGSNSSGTISLNAGGNVDLNELVVGARLYLPVQTPGALFSVGDPHYAQGDGEVCLTALEAPLRATLRLTLLNAEADRLLAASLAAPLAETDAHWIPMGLHQDLNEALRRAVRSALDLLVSRLGIDRAVAYAYLSAAGDFEITQVVDRVKGVHCMIRKADFE